MPYYDKKKCALSFSKCKKLCWIFLDIMEISTIRLKTTWNILKTVGIPGDQNGLRYLNKQNLKIAKSDSNFVRTNHFDVLLKLDRLLCLDFNIKVHVKRCSFIISSVLFVYKTWFEYFSMKNTTEGCAFSSSRLIF